MTTLTEALGRGPIPLDGGLGTRLETRGNDVTGALWSAEILRSRPAEVRDTHADFFQAGARAAITSSYQVSYDGFARLDVGADEVDALLTRSVNVAREAMSAVPDSEAAWVLASVGPYGASRGDGSEYTGDYADFSGVAALRAWHRRRIGVLAAAGPDALIAETLPRLSEAEAVCAEVSGRGVPLVLSFTVADGRLRSGESLVEAVQIAEASAETIAVGVNCSSADDATAALRLLKGQTELPLVIYPNSGEVWDAMTRSWSGSAKPLASYVGEWVGLGARLIGGCCRVDVDETRAISAELATTRSRY